MPTGFAAKYIVKKRTFEQYHSEYGPKIKYGKWIVVAKCDTQEEAAAEMLKIGDDFDAAIYFEGLKITKDRSRNAR